MASSMRRVADTCLKKAVIDDDRRMGLEYVRFYRELQEALGKQVDLCVTDQLFPSFLQAIRDDEVFLYDNGR